jgi:hypothetical protein
MMIHNAALRRCAIMQSFAIGAALRSATWHVIGSILCNVRMTQKVSGKARQDGCKTARRLQQARAVILPSLDGGTLAPLYRPTAISMMEKPL